VLERLNERMIAFIREQSLAFISTASESGECDCSFRTGPKGFVHVLDDKTLVYPELRGNGVLASLANIAENPHIAVLFLDFEASGIGLHVNGRAEILENHELLRRQELPADIPRSIEEDGGLRPERSVSIRVEEAYIHCAKHVPRFQRLPKTTPWGTDDEAAKGGDFFGAAEIP
jgi:predicted pyridoxine 5'-phosphate oxidase superfamily flavin-nucleotide-binding protein